MSTRESFASIVQRLEIPLVCARALEEGRPRLWRHRTGTMSTSHCRPPKKTARRVSASTAPVRTSPSSKTSLDDPVAFAARISIDRFTSNAFSRTGTLGALGAFISGT